ncbi:bifunctional hydroxymethylpyrimidine kinase/phosphomethylpyrimidine kinase [Arthrobacter sp. UM1]|uniref:bifunctional hydroxymethylpyrimidine kinase/phosphomethylpyrimidine kinase n=1 Tax=Arthrobacter sp. UM1 TaxID=2766776 RepID=UPI001CF642D3|nr:bifunctional hydroxymethylpyrimidine kinase/phosphomethylpyrimidine kinase [Arthrobacter sp. UM1]MCB4209032.1 bifunctional hydroxymethylpyrimidine kinase/phosphomethylpyrimidine kinase [Arthrobacter sp. UM1]
MCSMTQPAFSVPAHALTIAGSEATGGAGAQADLKTFQALGVFGSLALTVIVSFDPENEWDHRVFPLPQDVIAQQLQTDFAAFEHDAVKIGMLGSPDTIRTVATALREHAPKNLVLDPVLICKGQEPGHALDTDQALKAEILPLADFVTPNHFEATALSGMDSIDSVEDLKEAARRIYDSAGAVVLAKGGVRLEGREAVDVFYDGERLEVLSAEKVGDVPVSGAGCSLAAAVTAELAKGATPFEAAATAKEFVTAGIRHRVTGGSLPFDSFWQGGFAV